MATKAVTPSGITAGQIGKIAELLSAGLRKSSGLQSAAVQHVLSGDGKSLVADLVSVVRKHAEVVTNLIIRSVTVNRNLNPQEALGANFLIHDANRDIVDSMPRSDSEKVEVIFFKLSRWISNDDLEKEYEIRGLKAVDPYSLAAVNEKDQLFTQDYPNATHWKDANGYWCFASFRLWFGRCVEVNRRNYDWRGGWWFAGVRK